MPAVVWLYTRLQLLCAFRACSDHHLPFSASQSKVAFSHCGMLIQVPIMHLAKRVIVSEPGHEPQGRSEAGAARYYATLDDLGELTALQQRRCSCVPQVPQATSARWMSGLSMHRRLQR